MLALAVACRSNAPLQRLPGEVDYVGSSTVAVFLRQAEPVYGAIRFHIDTTPESLGGERLIREGAARFAGSAREIDPSTLQAGVDSALIGRDAIAVILNASNPLTDLSRDDLASIFAGRVRNWNEIGGPDLAIQPFIVGEESATREVFRQAVLGDEAYGDCETIVPDRAILDAVASHPGGVGQISLSLLAGAPGVHPIAIDGELPESANFDYPITRPLYLLWRHDPVVEAFVRWVKSDEGQRVVMQSFVGKGVLGSVGPAGRTGQSGTLIVRTQTYEYQERWDEPTYHPHRPYDVLSRDGRFLRRIQNHVGEEDESPTPITLPPGTYLIRTRVRGRTVEFLATVAAGRVTEVDVNDFLGTGSSGRAPFGTW